MISYSVYKVLHLTGVLMVFLSLGGVAMNAINTSGASIAWKKPAAITHGIGLLISLVGGFGLLARLGIMHGGLPGWALAKLCIWILFAGMIGVLLKKPNLAKPIWFVMIVGGSLAAYLAGYKPF